MNKLNTYVLKTTIPLAVLIMAAFALPSQAQRKVITKNHVPPNVLEAIQSDFPSWDMDQAQWYYEGPGEEDWGIPEELLMTNSSDTVDHYTVTAKGPNYKIMAVYDNKGKLWFSKSTFKNNILPEAIMHALANDPKFQGWHLVGNEEVIRNFKEDKKTYKVYLARDGKRKVFYFDRWGNLRKKA